MTYDQRTEVEIVRLFGVSSNDSAPHATPSFELDESQKEAIAKLKQWFLFSSEPIFTLAGRAGTGKSTIISEVIKNLGLTSEEVKYLAPTGKAVSVLKSKGNLTATTIHKFMYIFTGSSKQKAKEGISSKEIISVCETKGYSSAVELVDMHSESAKMRTRPKAYFASRKVSLGRLKLIIIDEASMINDDIIDDVKELGIKLCLVGDAAQLPPVEGKNSYMENPDVEIKTIHRQGANSPILKMANALMDGIGILENWENCIDCNVMSYEDFEGYRDKLIKARWQFLTAMNVDKDMINRRARVVLGRKSKFPERGDILLAIGGHKDSGVVNGIQAEALEDFTESEIENDSIRHWVIQGRVKLRETGEVIRVTIRRDCFLSGKIYEYEKGESQWEYGYAMTVHKSQGSSWENVVYIYKPFPSAENKLNYTAATRASKKLIVVKS
jgi:exodeoxyribonuclease-5